MQILQLTKKVPFPQKDGEAWAVTGLARGLISQGATVDLFSLNTQKHRRESEFIEELDDLNWYNEIYTIDVNLKPSQLGAIFNLFSHSSYHAVRFEIPAVSVRLREILKVKKYDVILIESIYMMHYASLSKEILPSTKVVLRAHNVEHLIWERYANNCRLFRRSYFKLQANRLKSFEKSMMHTADGVLFVSKVDQNFCLDAFNFPGQHIVAPIGIDLPEIETYIHEERPFIFGYIGSLDWRPNIEGLKWFLDEVWPEIQDCTQHSIFMIAGSYSVDLSSIFNRPHINFIGEIEDSDNFFKRIDALLVPLRSGSGTRVKILQALSLKTPVIGTPLAFEGLNLTHLSEVLLAEEKSEWVEAFNLLHENSKLREKLVDNGIKYLTLHHQIERIGKSVYNFCENL